MPTATPISFADLEGFDWAEQSIEYLSSIGIINGIKGDDGVLYYKPSNNVTRAEFCKLIVNAFDLTKDGEALTFTDINGHWAKADIEIASSLGIVNGYETGEFLPDKSITREELCVMIARAMKKVQIGVSPEGSASELLNVFADINQISDWALDGVAFTYKNSIIIGYSEDGVTTFRPGNNASRAETAVIIKRVYDLLK